MASSDNRHGRNDYQDCLSKQTNFYSRRILSLLEHFICILWAQPVFLKKYHLQLHKGVVSHLLKNKLQIKHLLYSPKTRRALEKHSRALAITGSVNSRSIYPSTLGRGRTFARSAISGTLCSHSIAIRWTPAIPFICLNSSICSTAI